MRCGCGRCRVRSCPRVPFQLALRLRVPINNELWVLTFSERDDDGPWLQESFKVELARRVLTAVTHHTVTVTDTVPAKHFSSFIAWYR